MIGSLILLCVAAAALIAFSTSAAVGLSLVVLRRKLEALAAAAQARILLGAALLPALVCIAVMTAALAPSFGWIIDHCTEAPALHAHPHLCAAHHVGAVPASTLIVLGTLLVLQFGFRTAQLVRGFFNANITTRALEAASRDGDDGYRVLPFEQPQAFVLGAFRPELFVTAGLLSDTHSRHLAPVLAHEHAHVNRRDPLRSLVSTLALAFHLPGVAGLVQKRLAQAQEMAADAEAARELGSASRIAEALVQLARAQRSSLAPGLAFTGSNVEARVAMLLDDRPRADQPRCASLLVAAAVSCALLGLSADTVHHGVEIALGLFGH